MARTNVGSLQVGNLGFLSLPTIIAKAWDLSTTYLLTGEKRPENGTPRVQSSALRPRYPGRPGTWVGERGKSRSDTLGIQANEPGASLLNYYTPGFVPTFD